MPDLKTQSDSQLKRIAETLKANGESIQPIINEMVRRQQGVKQESFVCPSDPAEANQCDSCQ